MILSCLISGHSGWTSPPENSPKNGRKPFCQKRVSTLEIPTIDFASIHVDNASREAVVEKVRYAAEKWGFFQVINHGIPLNVLEDIKDGVRRFHEEDPEIILKDAMIEYSKHVMSLGGIPCHYYPPCPQPDLTLGASKHSYDSFLTLLLQDNIGGLQILHQDSWIDVAPLPGALVVNIGDFLQIMTNDKFVSVEHRVLANRQGPRISVASLFSSSVVPNSIVYGPMKELVSEENPPKYRDINITKYSEGYLNKGLDGTSHLLNFRI